MSASRVRIRLPHSHAGLLLLTASLAAMMAIPVVVWQSVGMRVLRAFPEHPGYSFGAIMLGLMAIPFLTVITLFVRHCQHAKWVAAAGATYGFTLMLFALLGYWLERPWLVFSDFSGYAGGLLIPTVLGTFSILLALLLQRIMSFRIIEQDGTLCDRCGYPAARSQSPTCPECGHVCNLNAMTRGDQLIARFARRRGFVLTLLGTIGLLAVALVLWTENEYRTLGRSFGESWASTRSLQTYRALDGNPHEAIVYVELRRRPAWKPHEMHIGFGHLVVRPHDGTPMIGTGDPNITMRVPITKVRSVLRKGPPEHAINRLHDAAVAAKWSPTDEWYSYRKVEIAWDDAKR